MQTVVLVPGIFGTTMVRASDGFLLWPPISEAEPIDTETRARGIVDPTTSAGVIIEGIPLLPSVEIPEYGPLIDVFEGMAATTLLRFPYDWRQDVRDAANDLAAHLAKVQGDIVIVAHSMGGLVCRFLLESGRFDAAPWFGRVKQLVCIATPHLGAPLAAFRVMGLEGLSPAFVFPGSSMGILASNPTRFPAGHQLLPPATERCVRLHADQVSIAKAFPSIAAAGIAAGAAVYETLARFRRPPRIAYRFAYGHGHVDRAGQRDTTVGILIDDRGRISHLMGDGDGTVPFASALPSGPAESLADQFGVVGEHVGMLADKALQSRLEDWIAPRFV